MGLNVRGLILTFVLGTLGVVHAEDVFHDPAYFTIKKTEVSEVSVDVLGQTKISSVRERNTGLPGLPDSTGTVDGGNVGKIISNGRDLVALGEDIYRLVIKGKPSNSTKYAPISVVPKVAGEPVDILETEAWSFPMKRTYQVVYKNAYNVDVVTFRYSVVYSYGGSYEGTGAYLTAVQIVPESVVTLFGFDFTATMKLGGIVNQGTKANPIAGATLIMEYTVSSMVKAINQADTFFVNGKGAFKKL